MMAIRKKKEDSAKEPNGKDSNRPVSLYRLDALTLHTEKHCYFKPEEWTEEDGTVRNRVILVANKFYPTPEKEDNKKGK